MDFCKKWPGGLYFFFSLALSLASFATACDDDSRQPGGGGGGGGASCVQGQQNSCSCGALAGVQICNNGVYGSCSCEPGADTSGGGSGDTNGTGDGGGSGDGGGGGTTDGGGQPTAENPTPGCYKNPETNAVDGQGLELAPYPNGKLPGERCDQDSDCMHGLCSTTSIINQGNFPVCVKRCGGCGTKSPACNWDDDDAAKMLFTCVIGKDILGNNVSHCARRCDSAVSNPGLGGCQLLDEDYTSCNDQHAGRAYCGGW